MASSDPVRREDLERENARLRRSVQELSLLNDLARAIGAAQDAGEVIHTLVRRAIKAVGAEQGVVTLVEDRAGDPMTTLVRTAGSADRQDAFHLDDNLLGWMMHYKQPLRIDDPAGDTRFKGVHWDPAIQSVLCVPLLVRARLIGLLAVFNKKPSGGFTDDDQRLLAIIASQSAQIVENARLHEEERALILVRKELRLAHEIQTNLLPAAPPSVPGYEIAGTSRPARTVGGDYFDYLPLAEDRLALCVGDVAGKGLPAALMMANVQATLHAQAPWSDSASSCLERVNAALCQRLRKGAFVTFVYGLLDPHRHTFRYANAGHNRPLLRRAGGSVTRLDLGGLVLGFRPAQAYREATCVLDPGDVLLLYSDGVTEAMNEQREEFGEERLTALLATHGDVSATACLGHLLRAVDAHAGAALPNDDVTLLILKRLSNKSD